MNMILYLVTSQKTLEFVHIRCSGGNDLCRVVVDRFVFVIEMPPNPQQKHSSTFYPMRYRYRNNVPDPPVECKFLPIQTSFDEHVKYKPTEIDTNQTVELHIVKSFAVPMDLVNPNTYRPATKKPSIADELLTAKRSTTADALAATASPGVPKNTSETKYLFTKSAVHKVEMDEEVEFGYAPHAPKSSSQILQQRDPHEDLQIINDSFKMMDSEPVVCVISFIVLRQDVPIPSSLPASSKCRTYTC